jgi:hypothetical protein
MIQRIQSIFLLLAAVSGVCAFFIPFWTYTGIGVDFTYSFGTMGVTHVSGNAQLLIVSTLPIIILLGLHVILDFVSLFYYKNRSMQIRINTFNIFITLIVIGTVFLWVPYMIKESVLATEEWNYGLLFPVISFIFLLLANRFIKKDEKLVKAADRLR